MMIKIIHHLFLIMKQISKKKRNHYYIENDILKQLYNEIEK